MTCVILFIVLFLWHEKRIKNSWFDTFDLCRNYHCEVVICFLGVVVG